MCRTVVATQHLHRLTGPFRARLQASSEPRKNISDSQDLAGFQETIMKLNWGGVEKLFNI